MDCQSVRAPADSSVGVAHETDHPDVVLIDTVGVDWIAWLAVNDRVIASPDRAIPVSALLETIDTVESVGRLPIGTAKTLSDVSVPTGPTPLMLIAIVCEPSPDRVSTISDASIVSESALADEEIKYAPPTHHFRKLKFTKTLSAHSPGASSVCVHVNVSIPVKNSVSSVGYVIVTSHSAKVCVIPITILAIAARKNRFIR